MIPVGSMVHRACEAARRLRKEGFQPTVVNPRFIKPLDSSLLCSLARELGRVVTVEENVLAGGFGSAVVELLQERGLWDVKVLRLGIGDEFLEHGPQGVLREKCGLHVGGILKSVRSFLGARLDPGTARLEVEGLGEPGVSLSMEQGL